MMKEEKKVLTNAVNTDQLTKINIRQDTVNILNIYIEIDSEKDNISLISDLNSSLNKDLNKDIIKIINSEVNSKSKEIFNMEDNNSIYIKNNNTIIPLLSLDLKELVAYHNPEDLEEKVEDLTTEVIFSINHNKLIDIKKVEKNLKKIMEYIYLDLQLD